MSAFVCPRCDLPLVFERQGNLKSWACGDCGGHVLNLSGLKKEASQVQWGWLQHARNQGKDGEVGCPACRRPMKEVETRNEAEGDLGGAVLLDVCDRCTLLWFDSGEQQRAFPPDSEAPRDAVGNRTECPDPARSTVERVLWSDLPGNRILLFLGMPLEDDEPPRRERAWCTWGLIALMTAILFWQQKQPPDIFELVGFVPADPWRGGGVPILLAGVFHLGICHWLGNMYFFRLYGDNVEEVLGPARFLVLILVAHISGLALHSLVDATAEMPVVGFSCSVSGVMAYYALRFPRTGIFVWVYFRFLRVQVWALMMFWILLQVFLAVRQIYELTTISGMGHLGGVVGGGFLYCCWDGAIPGMRHKRETG